MKEPWDSVAGYAEEGRQRDGQSAIVVNTFSLVEILRYSPRVLPE